MVQKTKYKALDVITNEIFSGKCSDVARRLGANPSNISAAATRSGLYRDRYKITKEVIEIDKPRDIKGMAKAYRAQDELHNWYIQFRARYPKKEVRTNG